MWRSAPFNASLLSSNSSLIPMTWNDPRFLTNTASSFRGSYPTSTPQTISNLDWNENPGYADGDQIWFHGDHGIFTATQCRFDWREGPRITGPLNATDSFTWDQGYSNCVGKTGDHADNFQAFIGGGGQCGIFKVTNSFIRAYSDAEAVSVYGAGFVGSTGLFWSDNSFGSVIFNSVLVMGGTRQITIDQSTLGAIHVDFNNVYFVPSAGFPTDWLIRLGNDGTANIIVDNWTNVFRATIVGGVIVPGASIAQPTFGVAVT